MSKRANSQPRLQMKLTDQEIEIVNMIRKYPIFLVTAFDMDNNPPRPVVYDSTPTSDLGILLLSTTAANLAFANVTRQQAMARQLQEMQEQQNVEAAIKAEFGVEQLETPAEGDTGA